MAAILDLAKVEEPKFIIKPPDGPERSYDPWEMQEKIEAALRQADGTDETFAAIIRKVFGFPPEGSDDWTPTRHQCFTINQQLSEFLANLPVSKKLAELDKRYRR